MKSLKSITPYTQIDQFCDNQDIFDPLYFHEKVLRNVRIAQRYLESPPWFNTVPSLEKLCQAVVARNEQGNVQPTLNKGAEGASLTVFVTECRLCIMR